MKYDWSYFNLGGQSIFFFNLKTTNNVQLSQVRACHVATWLRVRAVENRAQGNRCQEAGRSNETLLEYVLSLRLTDPLHFQEYKEGDFKETDNWHEDTYDWKEKM